MPATGIQRVGHYTSSKPVTVMMPQQHFTPGVVAYTAVRKVATTTIRTPVVPMMPSVAATAAAAAFKETAIKGPSVARQLDTHQGSGHSAMLICSSLDQWHNPEAEYHPGFLVPRSIDPLRWQLAADQLFKADGNRPNDIIHQEVVDLQKSDGEGLLRQKCQDAANALVHDLEPALREFVSKDAQALADITCKLVPQAKQLIIKLELLGSNACIRWHQDQYVCRSIVSYNCSATQYTADSNVNFHWLHNGAKNDDIIRDRSRIRAANVGDMMFMKGTLFPGKARGLVHKSPEIKYFNGHVQARLILKVDVQDLV
eukprot:CAMPEP_0197623668 /NCGR_PEP_ID=MMETSP1338-20131121/3633_1 /TAXON_ID=43686 ORGANISM="Pelagodinium beii, Strain RCC1491" /NCGR_SAMPLE_ID=MMETSP1338 /ASSEMBLY_ACC=CAM_ASM_000754 /LENGTH=313 /DNA_ID=CAMNT_0043193723 /DNA_START=86 /DNA_END=1027 /DNA_ORIENTATION=+